MTGIPPVGRRRPSPDVDVLAASDVWFLGHGLSYFVPEKRVEARRALRPRRLVPLVVVVVLVGLGIGVGSALLTEEFSTAPAVLLSLAMLAFAWYALTVLHARPILTWALGRSMGSLRTLLPMMTRALPLLLIFVTFLFINAEVWQLAASLSYGTLWLVVLLFVGLTVAFLLVRLPEEVDLADDDVDDAFLRRTCRGTPLDETCRELVADPASDPAARATVRGFERWNLVVVLLVIQAVQVLLLAAGVLAFFLLFGSIAVNERVQEAWTTIDRDQIRNLSRFGLDSVSVPLFKVSLFLSAFSMLYLTVSTVTDDTYREQFFGSVLREMEVAVGMRAVYLTLRGQREGGAPDASSSGEHTD